MSVAALMAGGIAILRSMNQIPTIGGPATVEADIVIAVAPSLEGWVTSMGREFSNQNEDITVSVIPLSSLEAGRSSTLSNASNRADAWIPEANFVYEMAGSSNNYAASGPSVAQTELLWVAVTGRSEVPSPLTWQNIHTAANDLAFSAALPSAGNSVEGIAAFMTAAASFYGQPQIAQSQAMDAAFITWVQNILIAVPERQIAPMNQLTRPPVSVDVGLILKSNFSQLDQAQFVSTPPEYNVVFNYPYLIRQANETIENAENRHTAAQMFQEFLLESAQQSRLTQYGFDAPGISPSGQVIQFDGNTAIALSNRLR